MHREGKMTDRLVPYDRNASVEVQFSHALEQFQLHKADPSVLPFDCILTFKSVAATQALALGAQLEENDSDKDMREQFDNWSLETKLWNLVEDLYALRLETPEDFEAHDYSSVLAKQKHILSSHPKLKELLMIITWIQRNSDLISYESDPQYKWNNTRVGVTNSDLSELTALESLGPKLVTSLDVDAPLRTNLSIDLKDEAIDLENCAIIYRLLLNGKIQEAIDHANNTENFALALILVGGGQPYQDPVLDGNSDEITSAGGLKHKLLWKETIYKLSQKPGLNAYEKLIYNYLSGGNITENLEAAKRSWEDSLLLYAYQLFSYKLDSIVLENTTESLSITIPKPQADSVDQILNNLSNAGTEVSQQSLNPLRIISGAVMIDQVEKLIENFKYDTSANENVLRILVHLSIFLALVRPLKNRDDFTNIIRLYISRLMETGNSELIPVYLSFIPDEKDARETYSVILSSITDKEERIKQLQAARSVTQEVFNYHDEDMIIVAEDDKLVNVLRRTVERVMTETEDYYRPQEGVDTTISLQDAGSTVDETDFKLYRAVEWFYENHMWADAIKATIVVIRRFLVNGKLSSLKQFATGNNFKQLITDYNVDNVSKNEKDDITEENKEELLEYYNFVEGLNLIDQWKSFPADNDAYRASNVDLSLDKTSKILSDIVQKWVVGLSDPVFKDFRALYIPYVIMELITIYQNARLKNWKYIDKAYELINEVADELLNDFLTCFQKSGRLNEFLVRCGELSIVSSERGIQGIFKSH